MDVALAHKTAKSSEMLAETDAIALNSIPARRLLSKIASKTEQKRAWMQKMSTLTFVHALGNLIHSAAPRLEVNVLPVNGDEHD